jgi:hypothetical protein
MIARNAAKYLFFADYLIWSSATACGYDENWARIAVISGNDRFVAGSFAQFVDHYIDDFSQICS